MAFLLHEFISDSATRDPQQVAVVAGKTSVAYGDLAERVDRIAQGLVAFGLQRHDRVAIYLPKTIENVIGMFGTARAGGVFVPVNPILKSRQIGHILRDSGARFLITSKDRLNAIDWDSADSETLATVIVTDSTSPKEAVAGSARVVSWDDVKGTRGTRVHRAIDSDIASILYTSGSTGNSKGVVLTHRNMVAGATSVAQYLENRASDRLLAVLPFSFDVGFSQLTTAFSVGATTVLHDFFLPGDVCKAVARHEITCITGVPPLWMQLADLDWGGGASDSVRLIANTGGKMPAALLEKLRSCFPNAKPYLMYGLTEGFRSTYLPPEEAERRPDSIGKAIPNEEILVVREDGSQCGPGEPGELVHRGALVAKGYWNDPEKTRQRFRPLPAAPADGLTAELAVWSGDIVQMDEEGFLYFVGRKDGMIKTSGYRVSPTEIEEAAFSSALVGEAVAIGLEDEKLGQKVALIVTPAKGQMPDNEALLDHLRETLPAYMVPAILDWRTTLPRNPNGKIDRRLLETTFSETGDKTALAS